MRVFFFTSFALVAFAFNSILCRLALRGGEADAAGFTFVRLASGAILLLALSFLFNKKEKLLTRGNWTSAFLLFAYAICFSFAYLGIAAGTGALILFGAVQITMIAASIVKGERPRPLEWIGLAIAFGGLIYLVLPGISSPPLGNAGMMGAAGVAWGFYTLKGKGSSSPIGDTTGNFARSVPMVIIAALPFVWYVHLSTRGLILAVLSGAIASGIGYTAWYAALKHLTSTRAAVYQLAVPAIAAAGGVVFLSEVATMRLWMAALLILGGIGIVIANRKG